MTLSCVFYVCFTISLSFTVSAVTRHQQELKDHFAHLNKIADFECGLPQPRLLSVQDLFSPLNIHGKAYFPEVTVLHRCDRHSGSCNDGTYWCAPQDVTNISVPFKVTFLEEMNGYAKGQWMIEYQMLENHTSCGCVKAQGKPSKTFIHYHYVDPSLMSPSNKPHIRDMTQIAEGQVSNFNEENTEMQDNPAIPSSEYSATNEAGDFSTTPIVPLTIDQSSIDVLINQTFT